MNDFLVGFAFCASIAALVVAWCTMRKVREAFNLINNRNTRTVTVDMRDGKITVVKEFKNDTVDASQ